MPAIADRNAPRFRVDLSGRFRRVGTFPWAEVAVLNLSKTGLCLLVKAELAAEDLIEVEVDTKDSTGKPHRRRVLGTVQWRRGNRYGIRFI